MQVGEPSDISLRAPLSLFSQIANEPVFDQLRTKEQLGYLVFSGIRRSIGSLGWRVIVQSERDAPYLEGRVDAFLEQFKGTLEKMTEQEFEGHKRSIIHKKLENVKNLVEESQRFWSPVFTGNFDFLARYADVEAITKTTKAEVMDLFMKYIHPNSTTRSKLSVHLNSTASPALRFSTKAVDALEQAVNAQGLPVPKEAFDTLRTQQPAIESVKDMASEAMAQSPTPLPAEAVKQMLGLVDSLAAQFPFTDDSAPAAAAELAKVESAIKPQEVTDATTFKAQLNPSKAAVPVKSFEELAKDPSEEGEEVARIAEAVLKKAGSDEPKANL